MKENNIAQPTDVMKVAEKAVKGSFLIFIGNTSSTVIFSAASVVIARLLGPSDYGLYSIALVVPSLMLFFTDFGVNQAFIRFAARFKGQGNGEAPKGLIRTVICFELSIGLLTFLISLSVADLLAKYLVNRPSMTHLIQVASPAILASVLFATSRSIFVGLDEMDKAALLSPFSSVVKVIAAPTLVVLGWGVTGALAGHVLGYLAAGVFGSLIALRISCRPRHESHADHLEFMSNLVPLISYGLPLYASDVIWGFLGQHHIVILPWFVSNADIGNYSVALVFSSIVALLTTPLSTVLFPAFARFDPIGDIHDLKEFFKHSLRYTLLIVVPASVFIAVASGDLVEVFYGSKYDQAPLYLSMYSATFLLSGYSIVLRSFFSGIGRPDVPFRVALIQMAATISLSLPFTALFGVAGFICATVMSGMLSILYQARVAHKYRLQFDSKHIIRILLASLLSSVPTSISISLSYSPLVRVVAAIFIFSIAYLTLTPILGSIEHQDLTNLGHVFQGFGVFSKLSSIALSYEERILSLTRGRLADDAR